MATVSNSTPLAMMTVGQLTEYLRSQLQDSPTTSKDGRHYVYGIEGICSLFGCRRNKALQLKQTIIKDAVYQYGRKIVVDADKAIQLFEASRVNK